jgi:hypothetical protein
MPSSTQGELRFNSFEVLAVQRPRNFLQSDNRINHEVTPVHGVSIIHELQAAGEFDKLVSCSSG